MITSRSTAADRRLIDTLLAAELTMCSPNRCAAWARALRQVLRDRIPGDIAICGVWRGGLAILAGTILRGTGRKLYLYDTFEGMTAPGALDGETAAALYSSKRNDWCRAGITEVRRNLAEHGIPAKQVVIIAGDVVQTLAQTVPHRLAAAYLDTDFFESTRAELRALYPRLQRGAPMFFDDYGTWPGCKLAVDQHIAATGLHLHKVSDACRYVVRP